MDKNKDLVYGVIAWYLFFGLTILKLYGNVFQSSIIMNAWKKNFNSLSSGQYWAGELTKRACFAGSSESFTYTKTSSGYFWFYYLGTDLLHSWQFWWIELMVARRGVKQFTPLHVTGDLLDSF